MANISIWSVKKFRAKILTIFSLLFWSKRWHQKDISKLTDLWNCLAQLCWQEPDNSPMGCDFIFLSFVLFAMDYGFLSRKIAKKKTGNTLKQPFFFLVINPFKLESKIMLVVWKADFRELKPKLMRNRIFWSRIVFCK